MQNGRCESLCKIITPFAIKKYSCCLLEKSDRRSNFYFLCDHLTFEIAVSCVFFTWSIDLGPFQVFKECMFHDIIRFQKFRGEGDSIMNDYSRNRIFSSSDFLLLLNVSGLITAWRKLSLKPNRLNTLQMRRTQTAKTPSSNLTPATGPFARHCPTNSKEANIILVAEAICWDAELNRVY